jgi:hypothetical protein
MPRNNRQKAANKAHRARVGQDLAHALAQAADAALNAYVALIGLPPDLPVEGFDAALQANAAHQAARRAFSRAWKAVNVLLPDKAAQKQMLRLEEAANDLAVKAAEVGWQLGLVAKGAARDKR